MMSVIQKARRMAPGFALTAAVAMVGCSKNGGMMGMGGSSSAPAMASAAKVDTGAATLRQTLDSLLQEHVVLASATTGAALGGRNDEFGAAAAALDANSVELSKAVGSVYGPDAEAAFLPLWRKHIGFFVDYTKATAANDSAAQTKSVNDLIGYTQDFGAFLDSATGGRLKKDAVADLVKTHVVGLKGVVDAQAAKDYTGAYTKERDAEKHMFVIGNALAGAIVDQFPDKFAQ